MQQFSKDPHQCFLEETRKITITAQQPLAPDPHLIVTAALWGLWLDKIMLQYQMGIIYLSKILSQQSMALTPRGSKETVLHMTKMEASVSLKILLWCITASMIWTTWEMIKRLKEWPSTQWGAQMLTRLSKSNFKRTQKNSGKAK